MNLGHVHPAYASMRARWEMAYDFWRTGKFVLQPNHSVARHSFQSERSISAADGAETNPDAARSGASRYEWTPATWWKSYLWPHEWEKPNEYDKRCAAAYHEPHFAPLVNDVVSSILRTPPQRDGSDAWKEFWSNVDGCDSTVEAFVAAQAQLAFVFGRQHVLVDLPRFDRPAVSRADQIARGERPYWVEVPALSLRNWCVDDRGRWVWVQIAEAPPDGRDPGDAWKDEPEWMRVWTRDEWVLFSAPSSARGISPRSGAEADAAGWTEMGRGSHGFKEVPLVDIFVARGASRRNMECESPFAAQIDLDRHLFNEASEIWESDRTQSFASLWVQTDQGEQIGSLDIGPGRAHSHPIGTNAPSYAAPPAELNAERWKRHLEKRAQGRAASGIGRGAAEGSKEQRSAEAIVEEMRGQLSQMAGWAGSIQSGDQKLHRLTAIGNGEAPEKAPRASYMRSFYRMAVLSAANTINQLVTTGAVSRKAAAIMVVPVVQTFLADYGVEAGLTKTAADSIMEEAEKDPPPPVVPPTTPGERPNPRAGMPGSPVGSAA